MENILTDWCDFCEEKKDFDKSHFLTLFHADIDKNYLNTVLQYFPNKDDIIQRVLAVREAKSYRAECFKVDENFALELASKDINEKRKACAYLSEHELTALIDTVQLRFTSDPSSFEKARHDDWNREYKAQVGYYFDESWMEETDKYYAIFEAFYGMTNSYELQWYLGKPLMRTFVDPDNYFELWKVGGDYAFTETEILVAQA